MCICSKTFYKWIKYAAWSIALSGASLLCLCYFVKKFILSIISGMSITLRVIEVPAIYLIYAGIILRIIYGVFEIIAKLKNDREDENIELSEVPNE